MNNTLKKGLVSIAAASMLSSLAFAGSSVTLPSTYSAGAGNLDSYTAPRRNVTVSIQELGVAGFAASGYFTLKLNANTVLEDANSTNALSGNIPQANLGTSTVPLNIIEGNITAAPAGSLSLEYNNSFHPAIISGLSVSAEAGTSEDNTTYMGTSTSGFAKVIKYSTLGDSNTTSDGNTTVGKAYYDSTTGETYITLAIASSTTTIDQIKFDLNVSVDSNVTGDLSFALMDGDASGNNGIGITATTIKLYDIIKEPAVFTYNAAKTVPNITVSTGQPVMDFNITLAAPWSEDGGIDTNSSFKLKLTNAIWNTDANESDNNITNGEGDGFTSAAFATLGDTNASADHNISFLTTSTAYDTLVVRLDRSDDNQSVQFRGQSSTGALLLNGTGQTVGSAVTATVTGTGKLSHMNSTTATLATVASDGVVISPADANVSAYTTKYVVPGRTEQKLVDINISEIFASTFSSTTSANQITLSLPTGYTFSSSPTARIYTQGSDTVNDENNLTAALGTSTATIQIAAAASGGDIDLSSVTTSKENIVLSSIKVTVPASAVDAYVVPITLAGSMFSSSKTLDVSTINAGTVVTSVAAVTELNTTIGTVATSSQTSITDGFVAFDLNESFSGQLTAGTNVSVTLSDGSFSDTQGTCTVGTNDVGMTFSNCVGSDSNKTVTYTISTASTSSGAGVRILLPAVNLSSVSTEKTITATIAGTAGVTGTINIASTAFGTKTSANSIVSATKGDVDVKTGELLITEGINNGITSNTTFKIIAPVGISFTGDYVALAKVLTSATDTTTAFATSYASTDSTDTNVTTTFNTNDTLTMTIDTSWAGSFLDTIKIKPEVNVNAASAVDGIQSFQVKDVTGSGIISTTGLQLLNVGTIATLTAATDATVEAGKTTSVVPTNATGTVTYASADTAIATVDAAGTVTVDANATEAATVVITATDSLTAQAASTTITVGAAAVVVPDTLSGDITIGTGWNLVSSPVDGTVNSSVLNAVAQKSGTTAVVWPANSTGTNYGTMGEAIDMAPGQGAWVLADTAGTASFTGVTSATTAFSLATHVASLTAGGFGGGGYYLVGTPVATTFADVITAGAKIVWTFDTANNTYVGVNPAFAGQTGFDADGYYGGATSATAISAGSGFWYSAQ